MMMMMMMMMMFIMMVILTMMIMLVMILMVVIMIASHGWRPPYKLCGCHSGDQVLTNNFPYVDSVSSCRNSELGQMLMTCGKLSNQAPSVKSRPRSSPVQ